MDDQFSVTGNALSGRTPEYLVDVAGRTLKDGVLAVQQPDPVVIKIGHFTGSIVTTHALLTKQGYVVIHKRGINRPVTINTLRLDEANGLATGVTSSTGEGRSIIICNVRNQAKARIPGVVKGLTLA